MTNADSWFLVGEQRARSEPVVSGELEVAVKRWSGSSELRQLGERVVSIHRSLDGSVVFGFVRRIAGLVLMVAGVVLFVAGGTDLTTASRIGIGVALLVIGFLLAVVPIRRAFHSKVSRVDLADGSRWEMSEWVDGDDELVLNLRDRRHGQIAEAKTKLEECDIAVGATTLHMTHSEPQDHAAGSFAVLDIKRRAGHVTVESLTPLAALVLGTEAIVARELGLAGRASPPAADPVLLDEGAPRGADESWAAGWMMTGGGEGGTEGSAGDGGWLSGFGESVSDIFSGIGDWVGDAASNVGEWVGDAAESIGDSFGGDGGDGGCGGGCGGGGCGGE